MPADHSTRATEIASLRRELEALRSDVIAQATHAHRQGYAIHPDYRDSADNLLLYLALRRHDIRSLQMRLATLGLSSLGRAESSVLATLDAVLLALKGLAGDASDEKTSPCPADFSRGQSLLRDHTEMLLGPAPDERSTRIMVTMPSEAATDAGLLRRLLDAGMDCMRINCAHDGPDQWAAMIEHLRQAEQQLGKHCRVVMDLGGPKLRTGPVEPGPMVVRVRPRRDEFGAVVTPARVWLTTAPQSAPAAADAALAVAADWLAGLTEGSIIRLLDARGARRRWTVSAVTPEGCWAESLKTCYLVPGTALRYDAAPLSLHQAVTRLDALPAREGFLRLNTGDLLTLTADLTPGHNARTVPQGCPTTSAAIGCTIPRIFAQVQAGESIWFDDGKIGGVIETVTPDRLLVRIRHAAPGGSKLRADKGINLPDSHLDLPALTDEDIQNLPFIAAHADVVEMSFVNTARDVEALENALQHLGSRPSGLVLKVETRRAFDNLPAMILAAMKWPGCGVMIARGDLAIECGFERLAEVQEEILWICEAAHIPVIWATQVLETLAQKGMPSRAEITDAAMGHRAECVMLNKGPHVVEAMQALDNIMKRMQAHQAKKRAMLRELHLAHANVMSE
ncbi:pyruvate kinase [Mangrovitalea sediminis]|uniref:pyruvate kinase n=1 Tax=Mangrovitalea sediminis TaxID=1982043 RepID=UPI000BE5532F|nr:pyruvate kinase [Mangrovitalea sediminis]